MKNAGNYPRRFLAIDQTRMTIQAASMPRAANATFLAFFEAQDSADDVFIASGSGVEFGFVADVLSAAASTASAVDGMAFWVSGAFGVSVGAATGDSETVGAAFGTSAVVGASVFTGTSADFTATFTPLSGWVTMTGFGVSDTGVSTGAGAFLTTVTVERISPSGDESVTAHSEYGRVKSALEPAGTDTAPLENVLESRSVRSVHPARGTGIGQKFLSTTVTFLASFATLTPSSIRRVTGAMT